MQVSVTKESIRGVSNRLAGPKLFKIFEFHSQRADSVHHRTDSFLDRDPKLNLKSIRLWVELNLIRVSENERFAKCFESTLICGEPSRFWTESKRLLLNRFAPSSSRFSEKVFSRDI
ncbi:hypothetical protein PIB30_051294 [Stylosanthes scabra]|uniref:Uncharacterized protein n=1 Tax=Stylosanthes scabra TaxID=79078 RepID=A0ABU6XGE1_9FABA|nr:hypothetical protein [Stylosanthes scabra]